MKISRYDRANDDLFARIEQNGLSYYVEYGYSYEPLRVIFTGGDDKTRKLWQERLNMLPDKKTEAVLVYEYAKTDTELMYMLEERAAIQEYDAHLSGDIYEAIKSYLDGRYIPK